jgi:hypothetical protein
MLFKRPLLILWNFLDLWLSKSGYTNTLRSLPSNPRAISVDSQISNISCQISVYSGYWITCFHSVLLLSILCVVWRHCQFPGFIQRDDRWIHEWKWSAGSMTEYTLWKLSLSVSLFPLQISQRLAWDWNRASVERGRPLTTWAMARPL